LREDGEGNWGKIEKVDDIFSVWANRRCSEWAATFVYHEGEK
jgi:hypothetical protein